MKKATEDISRLPKWAQSKIRVLEMRLKETQQDLDEMFGKAETDVFLVLGLREEDKPLLKGSTIRFKFGDRWEDYMECRIRERRLYVNTARGGIRILPVASNCFEVELNKER